MYTVAVTSHLVWKLQTEWITYILHPSLQMLMKKLSSILPLINFNKQ